MSAFRSAIIAAVLAATIMGCSVAEPENVRHVVVLQGGLHAREGNRAGGGGFYAGVRPVPSEKKGVKDGLAGHPLDIAVVSATARSADIHATYLGETRQITVPLGEGASAAFGSEAVEVIFYCVGTSIPPLLTDDPVLNESTVIRKYDYPGTKVSSTSGASYVDEKNLGASDMNNLRKVLTADGYLTAIGADCFEPGMEFEMGTGPESVLLVVCLECYKLRIVRKGDQPIDRDYGITDFGLKVLTSIYEKSFPRPRDAGHS